MIYAFLAVTGAFGFIYWYQNYSTDDSAKRAAETVVPPQEKKEPMIVKQQVTRPDILPPRATVASTFNPSSSTYVPFANVPEEEAEKKFKDLNIANRYLYG